MITNVGRQMGKYVWVTAGRVGVQSASHVMVDGCSYAVAGLGKPNPQGLSLARFLGDRCERLATSSIH